MVSGKSHCMASPLGFFGFLLLLFSCCHPLEGNLGTGKGEGSAGWRLPDAFFFLTVLSAGPIPELLALALQRG